MLVGCSTSKTAGEGTSKAAPDATADGARTGSAETAAPLLGSWRCTKIASTPVASEGAPNLRFAPGGRASGFAGVNRFFGPFTVAGPGALSFGDIGATRMVGPEDRMKIEDSFLAALGHATGFVIEGKVLRLTDRGETLLAFAREAGD